MIRFRPAERARSARVLIAAVASLVIAGCAVRPHALDYVVLAGQDEPPPSRDALVHAARAEAEDEAADSWPIYDEPKVLSEDAGVGGGGCSVGLIGSQCERGLLEDVQTLEEQEQEAERARARTR